MEIENITSLTQGLNTVWVLLGAFLVFFMQAGFGMVVACSQKTGPVLVRV
jgi:ammonia channel protein AmtB